MHDVAVDIMAPILPNEGLGGFRLRTGIIEIQRFIRYLEMQSALSYKPYNLFVVRYMLENDTVSIDVDVRNGKIFQLMAGRAYQGLLFGTIKVGMPVKEAMAFDPRLYYDEVEEVILCKGCPGVSLNVPEIDPPPELVPEMVIDAISVYIAEIDTYNAQYGYW
ncbi:MAG: hypothetical protein HC893_05060 [Chloroflexaceae bacterium]|nr:hypothetical protein [Chloroflexaceae bacterium]